MRVVRELASTMDEFLRQVVSLFSFRTLDVVHKPSQPVKHLVQSPDKEGIAASFAPFVTQQPSVIVPHEQVEEDDKAHIIFGAVLKVLLAACVKRGNPGRENIGREWADHSR